MHRDKKLDNKEKLMYNYNLKIMSKEENAL